jgi:hypothetical protein
MPTRFRTFAASASAWVCSPSSAGAAVTSRSAFGRSQGIATPCSAATSARMSGRSSGGVAGLPHCRAVRSIKASRSGSRPALYRPWRASRISSAMSMPIGQAVVQRPHIVQAS